MKIQGQIWTKAKAEGQTTAGRSLDISGLGVMEEEDPTIEEAIKEMELGEDDGEGVGAEVGIVDTMQIQVGCSRATW